ncbi:type iii restriction res subunit family protein, putative [Ichthyophthirius multifiliis]|uniref:Type iii restriction res subunit family protein, putative n=1 Tax=Ichthyophthirius multifiliis TaxID=5932 RepID=G0QSU6_ICHMU|nr:type iii restriction res subunit family protein, putative [Ichthyophthirius multifiliis]EGR31713.1 type iii restriction res subunit family protein, putative [Ichthyophthirius multifiliis]|eukprot:XP_004035199.1 type iii restriction res subunit family protein, putative [Ichthyophthirius multifiliis]
MYLQGDYYGDKILTGSENLVQGTFDKNHPISYGVNNLYEGVTICHPQKIHNDFKVYAYNSNNQPLVVYSEANEWHGRIIVDCGFTKHWDGYWQKAGQHQYVSNANVWLT